MPVKMTFITLSIKDLIITIPVSLQLRYLQTLVEMAGEKNSTIISLTVDIVNAISHIKTKENGK
jgi:DNA-binding MurR/RpiR family transcriptional regulator|tara:strand:+ start:288 stop:479 length:192 start_codon:yes stop_codon:yes gene_type:complete